MKKKTVFLYGMITILGLILRYLNKDFQSDDWTRCWVPWMEAIEGPFTSIVRFPGDYNMPYVTLLWIINHIPIPKLYGVKILSVLFDYFLAVGAAKLVASCVNEERWESSQLLTYSLVVLSPIVIKNSSWWAQCDSIYCAFLIWSLYFFVNKKDCKGMVMFGFALAAKLQAIIAVPFLIIYWWKNKRFSVLYFLIIPVVMELLCIPAIMAGCSPFISITQYLGQTSEYQYLYHLYPNIWALLQGASYWICADLAIGGVVGIFAILLLVTTLWGKEINKNTLLLYCVTITMTALFFLPQMHERYGYFLEILLICLAVYDHKHIVPAITVNLLVLFFYLGRYDLFSRFITYPTGILYLICYLWILLWAYRELFIGKEEMKC